MKRLFGIASLFLPLMAFSPVRADEPSLGGLKLGVGLSLTHDLGWNSRVAKASVVNGIVRVDEERNDLARLVLEAHYFFQPGETRFFGATLRKGYWGHGPFVAVAPAAGSDKIIDGIGLGWMIGLRNDDCSKGPNNCVPSSTSWNFGVGFMLDANSKILGDGIKANQPLPAGEDPTKPVRLKDLSQGGLMFITSFSFN